MALVSIGTGHGWMVVHGGWVQPWTTRSAPGSAAAVERARARFREDVAWRLATKGLPWPAATTDQWGATHYRLPPVAPHVGWLARLVFGPTGRR